MAYPNQGRRRKRTSRDEAPAAGAGCAVPADLMEVQLAVLAAEAVPPCLGHVDQQGTSAVDGDAVSVVRRTT